ncbi:MAG: hypothetical protein J1F60_10755, partial [Oscillospiraceae bacterium]|nr:hypothetical protein [Oscillospiraceae bacterium]
DDAGGGDGDDHGARVFRHLKTPEAVFDFCKEFCKLRRKVGIHMSNLKNFKLFLLEEDGMGTVEVILIIVEIFTLRKQGILC